MKRWQRSGRRAVLVAALAAVSASRTAAGVGVGVGVGVGTAPAGVDAVVEQPRPFGYVVGDVLTQRVLLPVPDRALDPAALPAPARLSAWIERRAARLERAADGRRWLAVDYQVINAPRSLATVPIPAWSLAGEAGQPSLRVAAWPVGVAALTVPSAPGTGGWQLRPERPAPAIATAATRHGLAIASVAFLACLASWAAWLAWRHWRDGSTQPFASALRVLRRHGETSAPAYQALHGAFDRTAGQVLLASTLERLFERAPQLLPLRGQIERFYAQSAGRFFGPASAAEALSPLALCRALRRAERGSAR